jgi:hypothetical protein
MPAKNWDATALALLCVGFFSQVAFVILKLGSKDVVQAHFGTAISRRSNKNISVLNNFSFGLGLGGGSYALKWAFQEDLLYALYSLFLVLSVLFIFI